MVQSKRTLARHMAKVGIALPGAPRRPAQRRPPPPPEQTYPFKTFPTVAEVGSV